MKKLIVVIIAAFVASTLTFGQAAGPTGGGPQTGGQQTGGNKKPHALLNKRFAKQLNLSTDQEKQIKALTEKYQQRHEDLQKTGGKGSRKEIAGLRKQFMDDLAKILTPEQNDQLKKLMDKAKADHANKGTGGTDKTGATGAGSTGGTKTGGGGGGL